MKEKANQQKDDATIILKHHIRSSTAEGIIQEFKINESWRVYNRKSNTKLFHDIISFSPLDKTVITKTILQDLAEKYIELRGKDNLYLIVEHRDKEHIHMHAVVSGVRIDGYSSRISKQQFAYLKNELERYQQLKYPQLEASHIIHNKARTRTKEQVITAVKNIRQTDKQKLVAVLEKTFAVSQSKEDFIQRLNAENYAPYYRNSKLQGILADNRKFRFSTLGYDDKKFTELDSRQNENALVDELQAMRKGTMRSVQKEPTARDNRLQELAVLRTRTPLSQSPERVIDIDGCELPNVSSMEDISKWQNFDEFNTVEEHPNLKE